ncbi:MAG: MlaA family lipoprotein [Pseudomonadota bacterium]
MTLPTSARTLSRTLAALAAAALLSGCAVAPTEEGGVADPWEGTNRELHAFNKGLDTALLRPTAVVYDTVTPGLVRLLVSNGLNMLELPAVFVNRVLQGEPRLALRAAGRFGINVVFGGGLLDPATEFGLPQEDTDLGVTFARWGVEEGVYHELPLLGPATSRDAAGRVLEIALDPFGFVTGVPAMEALGPSAAALGVLEVRSDNLNAIDRVLYESEDSYVASRSVYIQRRRRTVAGGPTAESLPDVYGD